MTCIMTENGWAMLVPPTVNMVVDIIDQRIVVSGSRPGLPPAHVERDGYIGPLPSKEVCDHINWMKNKMKFFDDGVRLMPGGAERLVDVDNAAPDHPLAYPPAGWMFSHNTGTFVLKRSKYE